MILPVDAISDINKWFASIKKKIALKLLYLSLKQKYAKRLEVIWIISDVHEITSYKSKTCLLHQNLGRHPSQSYWNVSWMEAVKVKEANQLLPSAHFGQFWGEVTFSPISLFQSKSLECFGYRLALYHEHTSSFCLERFIYLLLFNDILFL